MTTQNLPLEKAKVAALETEIDSKMLIYMFEGATRWVEQHVPQINRLNVFPVPDGDTGINMMLTLKSAIKEIHSQTSNHQSVGEIASRMARGALMGARGNSGVILSQILRGYALGLKDLERANCMDLAIAFRLGANKAYQSVIEPVEGTILTVIRESASAAERYVEGGGNHILSLMEICVQAAKDAELSTPELLPVLKKAGVTDSGGYGLWLFLEGALRHLRGEDLTLSEQMNQAELNEMMNIVGHPQANGMVGKAPWGYDVQLLIKARSDKVLDVSKIRAYIESIGDCPLVVGDEQLLKIHVHCLNPGTPITYAAEQGSISDVVVEDMDAQAEVFLQKTDQVQDYLHLLDFPPKASQEIDETTDIGIVVVAPGKGIANIFRSLGVNQIVHGGQTMNPSTEELLQAIETSPAHTSIILPNNKNIILVANQIPALTSKKICILPTRTVPQGIAAVIAFNYTADVEENYAAMQEAMNEIQTGEVTVATRSTTIDNLTITEGDFIGLLNGQLIVVDQSPELVIRSILKKLKLSDYEAIAFYYGEDITPEEAQDLGKSLKSTYNQLDIDIFSGGQPHYHYIFSVE